MAHHDVDVVAALWFAFAIKSVSPLDLVEIALTNLRVETWQSILMAEHRAQYISIEPAVSRTPLGR